jgi:hypothetical protein
VDSWTLKKGPIICPETLVRNYHCSLCNNPEKRRSLLIRGGSLKSHKICIVRPTFRRSLQSEKRTPYVRDVRLCLSVCPSVFLSVCPCVRLSVCLSVRLSLCLSVRPSVSVRLSIRLSVCPSVYLSARLSVRLSLCRLSIRLSICLLSVRLSACPPVRLSVRLSACLSACPSVYPSVYPSVRLSVCLSVCPSVRPSNRLSVCPSVCDLVSASKAFADLPEIRYSPSLHKVVMQACVLWKSTEPCFTYGRQVYTRIFCISWPIWVICWTKYTHVKLHMFLENWCSKKKIYPVV